MKLLPTFRGFALTGLLVFGTMVSQPAGALSLNDEADTYLKVTDKDLLHAYSKALAASGESITDNLYSFNIKGCSLEQTRERPVYIHAVQDRGQPRGNEYPTYVLTTDRHPESAKLTFKTFAGKRIYLSDVITCDTANCLLSAKKGFSDICLADPFGQPAPDLPGLRKDFWTDLMGWLGL